MFKILRVNMTELSTSSEEISSDYQGLGGRGLTSAIINKEVDPILFSHRSQQQTGFCARASGRNQLRQLGAYLRGWKKPLTGGIKEANSGGQAGGYLSKLGIAAIVIEGMPKENKLYKLLIGKDKCEIQEAMN
jgi:aldehyde:ferredoxin oxidoreductase